MKAATLFLAIVLAASPVAAENIPEEYCEATAKLAWLVMATRQDGNVSLAQQLTIVNKGNEHIKGIVRDAYRVPRFSTAAYRDKAANDYRDEIHLQCLDVLRRKK